MFWIETRQKLKVKALAIRQLDQTTELIDKINNVMDNPENESVTGKYYQVEELPSLMSDLDNSLSFFNLNISSLPFYFEEIYTVLTSNNLKFDILCISKTILKLNNTSLTSISFLGYNRAYTTTELGNGGTVIYIKNDIKYKLRKDLQIYKSKELQSTFIEVIEPGKNKIIIVGCIYCNPVMELSEFNNSFLTNLLVKIPFEKKIIALLGDFNANLTHYDINRDLSYFLDLIYSNTLLSQTTTPSRITSKSATLTDNIFVNEYDPTFLSGNLTILLSDHLIIVS